MSERGTPGTAALLAAAITALQDAKLQTATALAATVALSNALSTRLEQPVQLPFNPSDAMAEHRRHHRSGTPSNVNSDPELRAFILARLGTMTFKEIALAVAATFPPERRTSLSSIQRFWSRSKAKR